MFSRGVQCLARQKRGQRAWTPSSSSSGSSPTVGVTAMEARSMAYRPFPLQDTVEYEEDFGMNLVIHREFVNRRHRNRLNFDVVPLAYSDTELQRGRQHLARRMNQERERSALGTDHDVKYETSVDPDTNEVQSARYLLNEDRMQFCNRFAEAFPNAEFHALMEASAILHGTKEPDLREAYFSLFLNLDRNSLDNAMEGIRAMEADHQEVQNELRALQRMASSRDDVDGEPTEEERDKAMKQRDELHQLESLAHDGEEEDDVDDDDLVDGEVEEDAVSGEEGHSGGSGASLPQEFMEFAPLIKSYLAHSRGEAPTASRDLSNIALQGVTYERYRWRALIDKLSSENFSLNAVELADARNLNEQLSSVKLFDLRLGDVVRDMVEREHRSADRSSIHHTAPLNRTENNPQDRHR